MSEQRGIFDFTDRSTVDLLAERRELKQAFYNGHLKNRRKDEKLAEIERVLKDRGIEHIDL